MASIFHRPILLVAALFIISTIPHHLNADAQSGKVVVKFKSRAQNEAFMQSLGAAKAARLALHAKRLQIAEKHGLDRTWVIETSNPKKLAERLSKLPNIEYAKPVGLARVCVFPNDVYFSTQWSLHNTGQSGGTVDADIDAPEAWNITTGSGSVVVAVLDTGIDHTHPDLASKVITGYNFIANNTNTMDDHSGSHGTKVASVLAAATNNSIGMAGVSWGAKLMPLKLMDASGVGEDIHVGDALIYAADNGAKVANMSLALDGDSPYVRDACNYALDAGVTLCAASGNSAQTQPGVIAFPAAYDGVIAVGATDRDDVRASWSQYGAELAVTAPGRSIRAAIIGTGYTSEFQGTSAAAPHAAGVCALVLSINPNLTPAQMKAALMQSADDKGAPGWDQYFGAGRINAYKALFKAFPNPADIRKLPAGSTVTLSSLTVSAVFDSHFYVISDDRTFGIKVSSSEPVVEGNRVNIAGTLQISNGERYIQASIVEAIP